METTTRKIAAWSVCTYALILWIYPPRFRRDFGEGMTQVFGDLARDACRASGLAGLVVLWVRTSADLVISVARAYWSERRRAAVVAAAVYGGALILSLGYGAIRFREFYAAPRFSRFGSALGEDALIVAYEEALAGEFGQYRFFLGLVMVVLAGALGLASATFGVWHRSFFYGTLVLGAGTAVTIAALSALPPIWFPFDRYPAGAGFVFGGFPGIAAVVGLVSFGFIWFIRKRPARLY
jgi:hypothetical protein